MMGGNHAVCGAAAWTAVASRVEIPLGSAAWLDAPWQAVTGARLPETITVGLGLIAAEPAGFLAGLLVCAGAALLPDADHRHASIAQALPPVSRWLCARLGRVAGGHRQGTHSAVGLVVLAVLAWLTGLWAWEAGRVGGVDLGTVYPGAGLAAVLLVSLAAKALRFIPDTMRRTPWVLGVAAGAFVGLAGPEDQRWFVAAVVLGAAAHVAGDLLTTGGCNILWPLRLRRPRAVSRVPLLGRLWRPNGNLAVPLLGSTGSRREWMLAVPVAAYALAGTGASAAALLLGPAALAGLPVPLPR
ncbi:metal-dependent hydrolase [Zafaria sp. Z1313]|uniref:metal-dependent hydrolase n=1 Tax=unclassified Zafaria TaxID=2828765 RepID=UPI002E7882FC|nr:metal-dependent hydrolase [Zafaria sp. J156]MEE1620185.1 metal-dependent hydrolase [Zafaria sp. J156]